MGVARWRGSDVSVRAWFVPRFFWFTVSIDVFLNGERILRTGGQFKIVGSATSSFNFDGTQHEARLSWGRGDGYEFPIDLNIDGERIDVTHVRIENWWMAWIRNIIGGVLIWSYPLYRLIAGW